MGLFDKLFKKPRSTAAEQDILWLYVQCDNCREKVKVRVNPRADLVAESGEMPGSCYTLHKEAMDDKCYRLIKIYLELDANRNILKQEITGGKYINKDSMQN